MLPPAAGGGVRVRELLADCRPLYNARITGRALSLARALAQCTIGISDNGYVRGSARERTQGRKAAAAAAGFGDAFCMWLPLYQNDMTAAFGLVVTVGPVQGRCAVSTEDPVRRVRFRRRRLQRGRAGRATLRAPINIVLTTPEYSAATRDEDLLPLPRSPGPRPSCPLQCCCINSPRRASERRDRPSYLSPESPHQSRHRHRLPPSPSLAPALFRPFTLLARGPRRCYGEGCPLESGYSQEEKWRGGSLTLKIANSSLPPSFS